MILVLLLLGAAASGILFSYYNSTKVTLESDQKTTDALGRAKEALIGRAVTDASIPGSFPCPDAITNSPDNVPNDGKADVLVKDDAGVLVCPSYIGRLPWLTLGLPDLRDASGERLWYALSPKFNDSSALPINSDTRGTITVYAAAGKDPPFTSQAVAVIFAPGAALGSQTRDGANQNIAANYLDQYVYDVGPTPLSHNNASANGPFIVGRLRDPGNPTYNDRVLFIRPSDFIPAVEMRVGIELKNALSACECYPWAASLDIPNAANPSYINRSVLRLTRGLFPFPSAATTLPSWFTYNNWHNVIYYGVATLAAETVDNPTCTATTVATCTLSVDGTPRVAAIFFTPGTPRDAIVRPNNPNMPAYYLEDASNIDANDLYVTPTRTTAYPLDRDRIRVFRGSFTFSPPNCNQTATALIALVPCDEPGAKNMNPKCAALVANLAVCSCFSSGLKMISTPCRNTLNPKECPSAVAILQACNS